jgi:hypothetical protein
MRLRFRVGSALLESRASAVTLSDEVELVLVKGGLFMVDYRSGQEGFLI